MDARREIKLGLPVLGLVITVSTALAGWFSEGFASTAASVGQSVGFFLGAVLLTVVGWKIDVPSGSRGLVYVLASGILCAAFAAGAIGLWVVVIRSHDAREFLALAAAFAGVSYSSARIFRSLVS